MKNVCFSRSFCLLLATTCASIGHLPAQQVADSSFTFQIKSPAFPSGQGPRILVDGGHFNFHSIASTYGPFANLLRGDGYVVDSSSGPFTAEMLGTAQILVIPNALNQINRWNLPTPSAFSDTEIALILEWVKGGGSLLLIADHMPFAGAAEKVASAFGIHFSNGFAVDAPGLGSSVSEISARVQDPVTFSRSNGLLADHVVTKGVRPSTSKATTSFNVRLKLFDADGKQLEEKTVPFTGHLARFFPEVFDSVAGNFAGKVLIEADQKIYLTVLRLESKSDGTVQLTSVPPQAR